MGRQLPSWRCPAGSIREQAAPCALCRLALLTQGLVWPSDLTQAPLGLLLAVRWGGEDSHTGRFVSDGFRGTPAADDDKVHRVALGLVAGEVWPEPQGGGGLGIERPGFAWVGLEEDQVALADSWSGLWRWAVCQVPSARGMKMDSETGGWL